MAASARRLSVLFVVLVLAHSQVQARESKFFSKVTHSTNVAPGDDVREKKPSRIEIPVAAPEYSLAPGPAPAYVEKEYGYGLYGHDSDMLPPARETYTPVTTTTTTTDVNEKKTTATPATATTDKEDNFEDQFVREELSGESFQTGYTNNNNNNNGYANTRETNGYANNYNTNAFTSTYSTTGQSENYNANGYPGSSNSNGYGTEKQGMSDTRYLENGKYYYDGKSENSYLNGHKPEKAATGNYANYDENSANSRETNGYANNYNTNAFTSTYSTTGQSENHNTNGYPGSSNSKGYGTEKQGMSDTRYLENGKYYYNGKSENGYLNGYEPEKAATGSYANYDNNSLNSNEFDTMEEYYKKQGYQESQEVYEP
ncbi:protein E6 [Rhodamnia argentea]|uniref:Protein E6 n=1 Tax=Rhodamnia argentea TaxID=178133 RepID=A0ABM3GRR1_9MYRT|nr:protein E6 [Rhodamnia argentea]